MGQTHVEIKALFAAVLGITSYEFLLQYDGLITLLTRWSIGLLTIVYLIYQIRKLKKEKYGKEQKRR